MLPSQVELVHRTRHGPSTSSGLLAQKRRTQKTEVRPQIHDSPDFRLLTKLGFQQPGDLSRIAQTAARKQPRELLHFAVLQRRHREGPYSPLISLLSLANPDQPSESLATLRLTGDLAAAIDDSAAATAHRPQISCWRVSLVQPAFYSWPRPAAGLEVQPRHSGDYSPWRPKRTSDRRVFLNQPADLQQPDVPHRAAQPRLVEKT